MKSTKCESKQMIEAIRIWFHNNGGDVQTKIKHTKINNAESEIVNIKPIGFENYKPNLKDDIKRKW